MIDIENLHYLHYIYLSIYLSNTAILYFFGEYYKSKLISLGIIYYQTQHNWDSLPKNMNL